MLIKKSEIELIEWIKLNRTDCITIRKDETIITTDWLVSTFIGSGGIVGKSFFEAWGNVKDYFTKHINSCGTVLGNIVRECKWSDYKKVLNYIKRKEVGF